MLVAEPTPTGWPPHDHGPTYRTHYNGHRLVRINRRPKVTRSDARAAWKRAMSRLAREWSQVMSPTQRALWSASAPPGWAGSEYWWMLGGIFERAGTPLPPTGPVPGAVAPPMNSPTITITASAVGLVWSGITNFVGPSNVHVCIAPGWNRLAPPARAHRRVLGASPVPLGVGMTISVNCVRPESWASGQTMLIRAWVTQHSVFPGFIPYVYSKLVP